MPRLDNPVHERFSQLLALKHLSQHAAWLEAIGPERAAKVLAKNKRATSLTSAASKLAAKPSIRARVEEIQAQDEVECRWGRKQLLDFYCECLERGAGTLTPDDRLCQGVERTTVEHRDSKGRVVRTVTKERLIMPTKTDCAQGLRAMLGWDKRADALPEDDITELLVMIRRKSGHGALGAKPAEVNFGGHSELGVAKVAEVNTLPETTESSEVLEALSRGHLEPLPIQVISSGIE
jgi:hypothetical protein